jgi:hypothetical protein
MTKGGLTIDQKMVTNFIFEKVKSPSDLSNLELSDLGFDETINFSDSLNLLARGLCLDLQRRERKVETIKTSDLKGAVASDSPVEYLRAHGYSDKTIAKIFNLKG